ncbi:MAG: SPFH domain-containing protein [Acidobacteria bacterium]|nr:MAG: SPFH domain-containing protein [Acidobacteriota bacterium]
MIFLGFLFGAFAYFFLRCIFGGVFTVQQNERAVITSFGRAQRLGGGRTIRELPISEHLSEEHRDRYDFPQVRVIGPGGPYWKWPWQKVHKVDVAIRTVNAAYDPEYPNVNQGNTVLDAVTKDQLNIGVSGQIRFKPAEENLYAYLFGVKKPEAHIMGYFVSILRESIATFVAKDPQLVAPIAAIEEVPELAEVVEMDSFEAEGISLNDLRKNLNELNDQMDRECLSSAARYGIVLDASLITGIDPPQEIESALAAITTAHNEVSADISVAKAMADQKIEQSKKAVEIQTMRAQAEVEPLRQLSAQLGRLKVQGNDVLAAYLRNVKLELFGKAKRIFRTTESGGNGAAAEQRGGA